RVYEFTLAWPPSPVGPTSFYTITPTSAVYSLSLHDALPISPEVTPGNPLHYATCSTLDGRATGLLVTASEGRPTKIEGSPEHPSDRKSTRLNSSHVKNSYAVFCLKKKNVLFDPLFSSPGNNV